MRKPAMIHCDGLWKSLPTNVYLYEIGLKNLFKQYGFLIQSNLELMIKHGVLNVRRCSLGLYEVLLEANSYSHLYVRVSTKFGRHICITLLYVTLR